ncbi:ATP-binding protein [Nostoc favosum]|uniref:ATP-binding protein n=1 Tax=Nostoc favosum CHAB5714 TaxID=2780399 RepID=A0ABS8ILQ5_9NOSO|nr:ATP-binding protein [Nostoc favosum]MCC5605142.1 ATP-binding protein [Nostoc favosum CHAB5714]
MSQSSPNYQEFIEEQEPQADLGTLSKHPPEIESLIEPIRKSDTYYLFIRDRQLFKWLDFQRDSRANGYVVAVSCADLRKACQFYRLRYVRKRGSLHSIPMPVVYAQVQQPGSPTDLFLAILSELSNPFTGVCQLKLLRNRTWMTLSYYNVSVLIIGNAHYLSYQSFNELVEITRHLKISVIPVGSLYLHEILTRQSKKYTDVANTFLDWHEFSSFQKQETVEVISSWESQVLGGWKQPLNLTSDSGIVNILYERSGGQAETLYEMLRKIAIFSLEKPDLALDVSSLKSILLTRSKPSSRVSL